MRLLLSCSVVSNSETPWTVVARQAPLSMGFSLQEYWSGLPFPPPGDLPNPGMELASPKSPAFFTAELPGKPRYGACMRVQSLQSCPTLCDPMDHGPPAPLSMGFSRQEYWSGLPFPSPVIKYEVSEVKSLIHVQLFATPWTVAYQAPPSMGFSR